MGNYFSSDFNSFILNLDLPILNLNDRRGITDYIDFIGQKEVKFPIMKGIDCLKRPFFIVRTVAETDGKKSKHCIQTFFQRYTDNPNIWMGCGKYYNELINTQGGINNEQMQLLINLVNGKEIEYSYNNDKLRFHNSFSKVDKFKIRLAKQEEVDELLQNIDLWQEEQPIILDSNIPNIDLGKKNGSTGYLDFITQDEVNYPLVKGIDNNKRPFFVARFVAEINGTKIHFMETFFQRYTDNSLWMGCGHFGLNLIETSGGINEEQFKLLQKLVYNEEIEIDLDDDEFKKIKLLTNRNLFKEFRKFKLRLAKQDEWLTDTN